MALTKEADPIMTPTGCDVAIIGAGASGLAAAWLLASRRCRSSLRPERPAVGMGPAVHAAAVPQCQRPEALLPFGLA